MAVAPAHALGVVRGYNFYAPAIREMAGLFRRRHERDRQGILGAMSGAPRIEAHMADTRTYRMELQYDGTGLHGWAKQEDLPTAEGALEAAFTTVLGCVPALRVAGRTDAGAHARKQVVSLQLPAGLRRPRERHRLLASLNALTPPGIAITRLVPAAEDFDARNDARSRSYRYHVLVADAVSPFWRPYCWWLPGNMDVKAMRAAAELMVGQHDFTAFTPTETKHVFFHRTVLRSEWGRNREGLLTFHIEADAFLRHMVRTLVGTMVEVGQGKRTVDDFTRLLEGPPRDEAGLTAPPQGLFLWDIRY